MGPLLNRATEIYRRQGIGTLFRKVLEKLLTEIRYSIVLIRGQYSLEIHNEEVNFSAATRTLIRRNIHRYKSEYNELDDFLRTIEPGDTVYDIGANTGLYSLFAAKICTEGQVISFEPYPPNADILRRDVERNELNNVSIKEIALSDSVGEVEFSQPKKEDFGYGSSSIGESDSKRVVEVTTTTGDEIVTQDNIGPPNVVKIDVEGAESRVINGMSKTLSLPDCRVVYCEVHLSGVEKRPSVEDFGGSLDTIKSELDSAGFHVRELDTSGDPEITLKGEKLD